MSDNPVKEAIQALYKPIEEIVKTLAGPAAEEIGLSFKDSVQTWRLKRQIRLFTEVKKRCDAAGINPQSVKLSFLFDVVDRATLEEDDTLQDRWANLVANAADPGYEGLISCAFPDILRQLSKEEAVFLEFVYGDPQWRGQKVDGNDMFPPLRQTAVYGVGSGKTLAAVRASFQTDIDEVRRHNLKRLGLIELNDVPVVAYSDGDMLKPEKKWILTPLGIEFIKACRRPTRRSAKSKGTS